MAEFQAIFRESQRMCSTYRSERRKYLREMKGNDMATYCRVCKRKAMHISVPTKNYLCDIVCECCGTTVACNVAGCIAYTYVLLNKEQDGER